MKKFIIGMTGIALCICLTACGTSNTNSSISSLSNQLDSTANALSNISTVSPSDINVDNSANNQEIFNNSQLTQQTLLNEQYYKTEILDRTAKIKNRLENVNLSKMQKAAIKDLTSTLNKYTTSVVNTKYEMSSSAKAISSLKKNVSRNEDKLNAKYNRLACNSNMRSAYYENIINTLDEIENCLDLDCENCSPDTTTQQEVEENNSQSSSDTTEKTPKKRSALKKNVDTYVKEDTIPDNSETEHRTPPFNDQRRYLYNRTNDTNVYNRYDRFNSSRNIDTYGPNRRNIDSFGGYGYGYNNYGGYGNGMMPYGNNGYPYGNNGYGYGYGNNFYAGSNNGNRINAPTPMPPIAYANTDNSPEQRLETYEKINPDNTIEKIENSEKEELPDTSKNENTTKINVEVDDNVQTETETEASTLTSVDFNKPIKMRNEKKDEQKEEPIVITH